MGVSLTLHFGDEDFLMIVGPREAVRIGRWMFGLRVYEVTTRSCLMATHASVVLVLLLVLVLEGIESRTRTSRRTTKACEAMGLKKQDCPSPPLMPSPAFLQIGYSLPDIEGGELEHCNPIPQRNCDRFSRSSPLLPIDGLRCEKELP